jgi:hypothetical protein
MGYERRADSGFTKVMNASTGAHPFVGGLQFVVDYPGFQFHPFQIVGLSNCDREFVFVLTPWIRFTNVIADALRHLKR